MIQKNFYQAALIAALISFTPHASFAETSESEMDQEVAKIEKVETKEEIWNAQLKKNYSLTDEQIKTLKDSGLSSPHLAMVAQLSKTSQKPLEDVLKMRTEQKKDWGEIAKELGVSPKEIGHAVRDLRHSINDEKKLARQERKDKKDLKKEERKEKRDSRKEERKSHEAREEKHGKHTSKH